jgi:hypothetical protein
VTERPLSRYARKRSARLAAPPPDECVYPGCSASAGEARVAFRGAGVRLDAGVCAAHEGKLYKRLKGVLGILHFVEVCED